MTEAPPAREGQGRTAGRVAKNTLWLFAARLGGKFLALPLVIALARFLGPEGFGQWALVSSLVIILSSVADGGFQVVTVRDLAASPGKALDYFRKSLSIRMVLTLLAGVFIILWGLTAEADKAPVWAFLLGGVLLLAEGLIKAGQAILTARERMDLTSLVSLAQAFGATALICGLLLLGGRLLSALSGLALVNLGAAGLILWLARPYLLDREREDDSALRLFGRAFPYGILTILTIIYFRIDVVMLSAMRDSQAAGQYNAALRLFDTGLIIPTALAGALFPVMSRQLAGGDRTGLLASHGRAIHLLALIAFPAAAGGWVYADWLVDLFYGPAYGPAGPVLALLSLGWVLFFVNIPLGNLLAASNLMPKFVPFAAANTALNVVLNYFLIPAHGAVGAVIATLVCEVTGLIIQYLFGWKILAGRPPLVGLLGRPALAGALLFLFWSWGPVAALDPWLSLVLGGILYIILVFLLRAFPAEDRAFLRRALGRMRDPEPV